MSGLTLDTGALIALERHKRRAVVLVAAARNAGWPIAVPMPVLLEWWRGSVLQRRLRRTVVVAPLTEEVARAAGQALGRVGSGPSVVDAAVMATAARRGDRVLTTDVTDLSHLAREFPAVRVLGAGG